MIPNRFLAALLLAAAMPAGAEVIGTMVPAQPVTQERLAQLDGEPREVWRAYLLRSEAAMAHDKAMLAAEREALRAAGEAIPAPPPSGRNAQSLPLDHQPSWYGSAEARALADNAVSFQTPTGGWGKNQDRSALPRQTGQSYIAGELRTGLPAAQDGKTRWGYVGTLDNDATMTEIAFLARVQAEVPGTAGAPYREAATKGIFYLLEAELPGGGWPQVYPLQGGYHDALTINDDVLIKAAALLQEVATGVGAFAFVPTELRTAAEAAVTRAIATLLDTQVSVGTERTIWAQQYDPLTRMPVGARAFEPAALATAESGAVLAFLMRQPDPDADLCGAIRAGAQWFADHALQERAWRDTGEGEGPMLLAETGASPLWSRFYAFDTGKPVFGDRDGSIHDDVNAISLERRKGYSWFNSSGEGVARSFAKWQKNCR